MKKIIALASGIFISCFSQLFSQSQKEVKENKIKSTAENVTAIENGKETTYKDSYIVYDKNGNITEQTEYHDLRISL